MKNLTPLNSQNFFCSKCGIGEDGNCLGAHPEREISTPGSTERAIIILAIIAVFFLVMAFRSF